MVQGDRNILSTSTNDMNKQMGHVHSTAEWWRNAARYRVEERTRERRPSLKMTD